MSAKFPILNDVNRYSVMEEAVAELFSILAASPAWLKNVGLMNTSIGHEEAKLTSMTITALDVLPRLAYYKTLDSWRLEAIERNETDPKKLTSDWWEHRYAMMMGCGSFVNQINAWIINNYRFFQTAERIYVFRRRRAASVLE